LICDKSYLRGVEGEVAGVQLAAEVLCHQSEQVALAPVSTRREHQGKFQGTFRKYSLSIQGGFRDHSGNIQGTFREHSGNIQGAFGEHSGSIQGTLRGHSV
jgi:hypothetical protein